MSSQPIPQRRDDPSAGQDRQRAAEINQDVTWALREVNSRAGLVRFYGSYYAGAHRLMISRPRLRTIFGQLFNDFRLNLCSAVVDALADRLQVASFSGPESGSSDDAELAGQLWRANAMRRQQAEVHRTAIACGDAYVIVWTDPAGNPRLYPQKSYEIAVEYDPADPSRRARAAKVWPTLDPNSPDPTRPNRLWRLNVYRPDRIEKWAAVGSTVPETETAAERVGSIPGASHFKPYAEEDGVWPLLNPYGVVPVFHFGNNANALGSFGVPELRDAVPVQDWINYSVFSMLVGQEYQGFPQRYAVGVEVPINEATGQPVNPFTAGPERLWIADPSVVDDYEGDTDAARVQVGQFPAANLEQLLSVKREAALSLAQATATPPNFFMLPSGMVSGESQKTSEQRLDSKVGDRQANFGDVWASAMALAVRMQTQRDVEGSGFLEEGLDTNWKDLKPRNQEEVWKIANEKVKAGVSNAQVLREQGYTEAQIEQFAAEGGAVTLASDGEEEG